MDQVTTIASDAPATPVTFTSKADNYRIVRSPARRKQLGESGEYEVIPGKSYQFYDGVLGPGELTQDDVDWLREQDSYGKYYFEPETAPVEDAGELQRVIMEKALSGDFTGIADILVAERTALSRPGVIASCEAAIRAGGAQLPAKPDVPIHELQRVRMGTTAGETPGVSPDPVPGTPMVDPSTLAAPDASVAAPAPPVPAAETVPPSDPTASDPSALPPVPPAQETPATPAETPAPEQPPEAPAPAAGAPVAGDPTEPPLPPAGAAGAPAA